MEDVDNSNEALTNQYTPKRVSAMNGFVVDNVACGGCHTLLTATKGSNADFTNNDFNIVNTASRQISLTELPPLQKIPGMNKNEDLPYTVEDVNNSNTPEQINIDNVNGNVNEESGSINSLEANVSGSHIVNINDLENDNGSLHGIPGISAFEAASLTLLENSGISSAVESLKSVAENAKDSVNETMSSVEKTTVEQIEDIKKTASDKIETSVEKTIEKVDSIENLATITANDIEDSVKSTADNLLKKSNEKIEVVENFVKTIATVDPAHHDDKILSIPDKITEIANSPPPKTPIIQEFLQVPDLSHTSPDISKHSDDGQSENETIPCNSDKSSPQAGKIAKTQAVMPIVRSEDNIDAQGDQGHNEETDVVVNKMAEKGRFARIFQSLKDKENSCISKGKVIEENISENVHKGIEGAEETIEKIEETVETQIRNHTNSRTCTIL